MKINTYKFDIIFILSTATILILLSHYNLLEKYIGLAFIPILIAYRLGQYSERRLKA